MLEAGSKRFKIYIKHNSLVELNKLVTAYLQLYDDVSFVIARTPKCYTAIVSGRMLEGGVL